MNVNLTNSLSFETNYNLKLVREDKLIQEVNTHNVINMQRLLVHNSEAGFISYLSIGQGTGTPTKTDISLFKVNEIDFITALEYNDLNLRIALA